MELTFTNGEPQALGTIFCVGRNYAAHIEELGNQRPEEPLIFTKPATALNTSDTIVLPSFSQDIHYETEIVVLIGKGGKNIAAEDTEQHIGGWGIGLDLTARDKQTQLKNQGASWELAKGFDGAACVSEFLDADAFKLDEAILFSLTVNDETRQQGNSQMMLFPIAEQIAFLSQYFTLRRGDILFTGTPKGVGKLHPNDELNLVLGNQQICKHYRVATHE
ncbi:fumarylacetoacetate hydrolase family protein [Suttonella ornithocola]|uniref:2-keto-4-pentenoate hydratase/2-oxohepta-3-ene-1,7-dioic acid hydratase (Catechol pathway) n=1 Tax=Suttonella ornithocola TaxID=279832 RepID=A0A380MN99_9GAMM|nr:fumarylacetoacetate hydrolase family protein [Suttonella ornithocola]SUO94109.1 2-keto-4-pentenoate hydratase/2-oxohepta-3-ene-1,7-dioic acid hydratase (catechol pathway) [Suttonella ornithocola]